MAKVGVRPTPSALSSRLFSRSCSGGSWDAQGLQLRLEADFDFLLGATDNADALLAFFAIHANNNVRATIYGEDGTTTLGAAPFLGFEAVVDLMRFSVLKIGVLFFPIWVEVFVGGHSSSAFFMI